MSDGISPVQGGMQIAIGDGGATISAPQGAPSFANDPASEAPFAGLLERALSDANEKGQIANQKQSEFLAGKSDDIHGTMIASKEAEIELRLVATVKNKVVDAINDLLRMSI